MSERRRSHVHHDEPAEREPIRKQEPPKNLNEMFGHTCRRCIEQYFGVQLKHHHLKYLKGWKGSHLREKCDYCGQESHIVIGLKWRGKLRMFGKRPINVYRPDSKRH